MTSTFENKISELEKRIMVLEAQLKREIDCSYCQKNRFIMKWLDESISSSSDSSESSDSPKRKRKLVDNDEISINKDVF